MQKIENLKMRITPLASLKQVTDDIVAGKEVDAAKMDLGKAKLKLELDADIATIQEIIRFIKTLAKQGEK